MSDSKKAAADTASEKAMKNVPPHISLASGIVAGGCEALITYPFEFAKTRLQLKSVGAAPKVGPVALLRQTIAEVGLSGIYVGCWTLVAGTALKAGVRFLAFDTIKNSLSDEEGQLTFVQSMFAGMMAGATESVVAVTPAERLKTAMIDDARNARRYRSSLHAATIFIREQGIVSLYRGLLSTTLKQCVTSASRMGSYSTLKQAARAYDIPQSSATTFATGAIAGTITVYVSQPLDTIKSRTQSAKGAGTLEAARSVLVDSGIRGFWHGSTMRLGRLVLSGGIIFTGYEKVSSLLMAYSSGDASSRLP